MQIRTLRFIGWAAIALTGLLILWGMVKPWGLGLDFANFYDAGQKALANQFTDLYDATAMIAGKKPLGNMTFFSAPVTSYLYAPMATLEPHAALLAFKGTGTIALVIALVLLYRHFREFAGTTAQDRAAYFAIFSIGTLMFQPFWTIYKVGGQTTPFVFLLFVLGLIAFTRSRLVATALTYSVAVLIKPIFAPGAILLFLLSGNAFRWAAIIAGLAVAGLSYYLFGLELHREFIARALSETSGLLGPWMNSSPFSFIQPWFIDPSIYGTGADVPAIPARLTLILRILAAVALLAVLARHLALSISTPARRHAVFTTGLAVSLILSPVVWSHYLSMLFPTLAACAALRRYLPRPAQLLLALATVLSVFQSYIFILQIEKRTGLDSFAEIAATGLLKSLPALLILIVLIVWHRAMGDMLQDPEWDVIADDES